MIGYIIFFKKDVTFYFFSGNQVKQIKKICEEGIG